MNKADLTITFVSQGNLKGEKKDPTTKKHKPQPFPPSPHTLT